MKPDHLRETVARCPGPASVTLGAAIFGLLVYRAASQSITYDEASTFLEFARGPWSAVFTHYTANNHVLFTLLAKLATRVFGTTELTLRLPTLAGAALYLASAAALCERLFPGRLMAIMAFAAMALNPFVLDFLVAARGYGLALGLMVVSLLAAMQATESRDPRSLGTWSAAVSVLLGLSVAANPCFAFAAAALGLGALAMFVGVRGTPGWRLAPWLLLPGSVVMVTLLAVPLSHARRDHFFYGAVSTPEMVRSLVTASLRYHAAHMPFASSSGTPSLPGAITDAVVMVAVLAAAGTFLWLLLRGVRASSGHSAPLSPLGIMASAATLLVPALAGAAHFAFGIPYPLERTAIYLLPLFTLSVLAVASSHGASAHPLLRRAAPLVLGVVVADYALQLQWTEFRTWAFDASSRRLFRMAETMRPPGECPPILASSWLYEPSLRFYAALEKDPCAFKVERADPELSTYDLYVLSPDDVLAMPDEVRVVATDTISGASVATREDANVRRADDHGGVRRLLVAGP